MTQAVQLTGVSVQYPGGRCKSLDDVNLTVERGEIVLLTGRSGCGKSTLLSLINGLVPHFHEAEVSGEASVLGTDPREVDVAAVGRQVSTVFQNPRTQFFCDDSTSELAFALENAGVDPAEIRQRIDVAAERLGTRVLMDRSTSELSGGQKQQVAITSAAVTDPRVYLFDEPTSNLDVRGVAAVRALLQQLRRDGATVVICEHRLAFLAGLVDRVVILDEGAVVHRMTGDEFFAMPDAEVTSMGLRSLHEPEMLAASSPREGGPGSNPELPPQPSGVHLSDVSFRYRRGDSPALAAQSLELRRGEVSAIIGPNGAGKSTLIRVLSGLSGRFEGEVRLDGVAMSRRQLRRRSYVVMQDVNRQLFAATAAAEVTTGVDRDVDVPAILDSLGLAEFAKAHPQALSGGQRQRLAVATAEACDADIVLFDEPTSGLDHEAMLATAALLRRLADAGRVVAVVTHDEDLVAHCADRVLELRPPTPGRA